MVGSLFYRFCGYIRGACCLLTSIRSFFCYLRQLKVLYWSVVLSCGALVFWASMPLNSWVRENWLSIIGYQANWVIIIPIMLLFPDFFKRKKVKILMIIFSLGMTIYTWFILTNPFNVLTIIAPTRAWISLLVGILCMFIGLCLLYLALSIKFHKDIDDDCNLHSR